MSNAVRVGVVGAGYWGPNLIRNVAGVPGAELAVICDADRERLDGVGKSYPGVELVEDFARVVADDSIDAVVLATPASTHHKLGMDAMRAGKDILVEKPLAMSVEECSALVSCAREHDRILMVGHTFIYNAAVKYIHNLVTKGELGEVFYVYSSRVNLGRIRQDVNALWNVAPHDISILSHVLGEAPTRVRAMGRACLQPGLEDVVFAVFEYPSGAVAHLHSSWLDPSKVRRTTFVGSEKMVVYDDVESEGKIKIYDKGARREGADSEYGEFQIRLHSGDIHIPKITFTEPLAEECRHFVECVRSRETPRTCGVKGMEVV
ncbi:MAG: Gfo/Idh/MocA family oxidoreductase, partial [Gemmatimonadota bacterium]|nr:Gfo/Idh/MocA family oxidoreductase [Gemmatimonadota bacterium]